MFSVLAQQSLTERLSICAEENVASHIHHGNESKAGCVFKGTAILSVPVQ